MFKITVEVDSWYEIALTISALIVSLYIIFFRKRSKLNTKLAVVLDLDECLVHVDKTGDIQKSHTTRSTPIEIDKAVVALGTGKNSPIKEVQCHVCFRPFLKELLAFLSQQSHQYEVHIFTASEAGYAKPILAELERQVGSSSIIFGKCWFRDSCRVRTYLNHPFTFKDLAILYDHNHQQLNLKRTVLIDDDPTNFSDQPDNGIPVRAFLGTKGGEEDNALNQVLLLLQELERAPDVRVVLRERFGIADIYQHARKNYPDMVPHQWEFVMEEVQKVNL